MNRLRLVLFVIYLTLIATIFLEAGLYMGLQIFESERGYLTRLVWTLTFCFGPILVGACLQKYLHGFALILIPSAAFAVGLTIGAINTFDDELPYGLWKTFWITSMYVTAFMWLSFSLLHLLLGITYKIFTGGSLTHDRPD